MTSFLHLSLAHGPLQSPVHLPYVPVLLHVAHEVTLSVDSLLGISAAHLRHRRMSRLELLIVLQILCTFPGCLRDREEALEEGVFSHGAAYMGEGVTKGVQEGDGTTGVVYGLLDEKGRF